jgi:DNA-binding response OmpR family regulator
VNPRLLVVDDDDALRVLYAEELTRAGYEVVAVESGEAAVAAAAEQPFALVILDIEMPDLSGIEVLSQLRRAEPNTPVILNTAYSTYKQDFQSWLADAYVMKSSDLEPLKRKINEMIDHRANRRQQ